MTDTRPTLTPALCRAARGLLDLTQSQLAALARRGLRTVQVFEKGDTVSWESVVAISAALAAQRIELVVEKDGTVGVLLRPAPTKHRRRSVSKPD
ncbi:hypothetical protein [Azospirillum sp. sgz302134]